MPPEVKEAHVAGENYTRSYAVRVFVIKRDGSRALPVGEQGESGDYIVKTTIHPDVVNGDVLVAKQKLFPNNGERLRFAIQVKIGRVV